MADAGSGSLVAKGYVGIRADYSRLPSDLSQVQSMFRSQLAGIAGIAGGFLAATGLQSFTSAIRAIGGTFLNASAQMENFTISLGVLLGSETRAKSMMLEIEQIAARTPFNVAGLTQAIVQLKVFGFETKKLIPTMIAIGDAAAASPHGMENGVQRISYALGEMMAHGRVMSAEMRQLVQSGVPAWDILAGKLGKTTGALKKLMQAGQIPSAAGVPMLIEGISERFGGMMAKQSRTWTGLFSTLTDSLRIFSRQAGQPIFDIAKMGLAKVVDWFNSDQATQMVGKLTSAFRGLIELVKNGLDSPWIKVVERILIARAAVLGLSVAVGIATIAAGGLAALFGTILTPVGALVALLTTVGFAFQDALSSQHGAELRATLSEIWMLTSEVASNLMTAFGGFIDFMKGTWVGFFGSVLPGVMMNPFQAVLGVIREVADWASLLTTDFTIAWELIKEAGLLAWVSIKDYLISTMDIMKATFVASYEAWKAGMSGIVMYFRSAFTEIGNIALAVWEGIKAAWSEGLTGDPAKAFKKAFVDTLADQKDAKIPGIGEMVSSAYDKAYSETIDPSKHEESKESKEVRSRARGRVQDLEDKRDAKRKDRMAEMLAWYYNGPASKKGTTKNAVDDKDDGSKPSAMNVKQEKGPVFQDVVEFAKTLQTGLVQTEADKAQIDAAKGIAEINRNGVKIKDPKSTSPPVATTSP